MQTSSYRSTSKEGIDCTCESLYRKTEQKTHDFDAYVVNITYQAVFQFYHSNKSNVSLDKLY
jgi:hypothetical protein